jgi:hypothetical protein
LSLFFSHGVLNIMILYQIISFYFVPSDDEEEEEIAANVTAPMSMSHTLALSETHRTAEETSTPHPDLQKSTTVTSPRASSPKRARIELGEEFNLAGDSAIPTLDDVSLLFLFFCLPSFSLL